jgi:type IV secretion system protein VirD4
MNAPLVQTTNVSLLDPEFPPRGSGYPERNEKQPAAEWAHPWQLGPGWTWRPGKILLGAWQDRLIGDPDQKEMNRLGDDRHLITIAGTRAGKSRTVLIPNLLVYPGSMIVIDPKGELARETALPRAERFGQRVVPLDPFGVSGFESYSYNPFDELDPSSATFIDDVRVVASALIVDGKGDNAHWTESAKALLVVLILYMFASGGEVSLPRLRRILMGAEGALTFGVTPEGRDPTIFDRMAKLDAFDGMVARVGKSFRDKSEREGSSIVSTAREQLSFLDSLPMNDVLKSTALRLGSLKSEPTTIYLCLPAGRLPTHFRWLRLIIALSLIELEKDQTKPEHPVLLLLEEFAALEHMPVIERAAGFMAGFGVRLWTILQDLGQLKGQYRDSWETFIGNAGIIQVFGNMDLATTGHLSKMLGNATVLERQDIRVSGSAMDHGDVGIRENPRSVPLLEPFEITRHFARSTWRQLILSPGRPPIYIDRLNKPNTKEN